MKTKFLLAATTIFCTALTSYAQQVRLHVNPEWEQCSIQLDPSLTQTAWHKFTEEAGLVTYFRPLSDARPLSTGRFEFALLQWKTAIDPNTEAWNNTFVHPDSAHWLLDEGKRLAIPGLMLRGGIGSRINLSAYVTKAPGANYGIWGGQIQYSLLNDSLRCPAVAASFNAASLYGPHDLNLNVFGLDLLASKEIKVFSDWGSVSPYAGISGYLSHSHEKSDLLNLKDENVLGVRGTVGAVAKLSFARVGMEYSLAKVSSVSFKLGIAFGVKKKY